MKQPKISINFPIIPLIVGFIVGLLLAFIADTPAGLVTGIIGVLCLSFCYKYPRAALWAFLIYMPFAGTVTYWIANGSMLSLGIKDIFYIPALVALIQEHQRQRGSFAIPKFLIVTLLFLLGSCLLTLVLVNGGQQLASNPNSQPVLMGLMGLKVLMGYIPLIFCAYYLIRNKEELKFLLRLHVVLALICCILAFIQYGLLHAGICVGTRGLVGEELFKTTLDAKCFVGGSLVFSPEINLIRLPGTFVSPWQWVWFLISNIFFTVASAITDSSRRWLIISFMATIAVVILSVLSGQTMAFIWVPILLFILLIIMGLLDVVRRASLLNQLIVVTVGIGLLINMGIVANFAGVQEQINTILSRWLASPPLEFLAQQFGWVIQHMRGVFGNGLGSATNIARIFGPTQLIETFYPKVLYEIGVLGMLSFLAVVTALTIVTFKNYRSVQDPNLRSWGVCVWVFILLISYNTYYYPLDVDPVAVYYWFFAGLLLKLPQLDGVVNHQRSHH